MAPRAAHGIKPAMPRGLPRTAVPSGIRPGLESELQRSKCKQACVYRAKICTVSAPPRLVLAWNVVGKAEKNNSPNTEWLKTREKRIKGNNVPPSHSQGSSVFPKREFHSKAGIIK